MSEQIAIVMSEVFLRRLTPALMPFVRREQDFRIVSIHRPINELLDLLRELNPRGLITEWLPEVTEAMLKLDLPTVIADTDYTYPGVVSIDVDGYRQAQEESLIQRVGNSISEMQDQNLSETKLPPMSPYFRRVIHLWISKNHPELATESIGNGEDRAVRIFHN